jgi:hypothetical protein
MRLMASCSLERLISTGGSSPDPLADLYVYDISAGTWTDLSQPTYGTAPLGRMWHGLAVAEGKLYVHGGVGWSTTGGLGTVFGEYVSPSQDLQAASPCPSSSLSPSPLSRRDIYMFRSLCIGK